MSASFHIHAQLLSLGIWSSPLPVLPAVRKVPSFQCSCAAVGAQGTHRGALAGAAGRLRELEVRRVTAIKDVVATFLTSYPCAITRLLTILMPAHLGDVAVPARTLYVLRPQGTVRVYFSLCIDSLIGSNIY